MPATLQVQQHMQLYQCGHQKALCTVQNLLDLYKMCAIAGHEGEAAAAHNNIADVADEDASYFCNPVSSGR